MDSDTKKKFKTSWKKYKASLAEKKTTDYDYKPLEDVTLTISESNSSSETSSSEYSNVREALKILSSERRSSLRFWIFS